MSINRIPKAALKNNYPKIIVFLSIISLFSASVYGYLTQFNLVTDHFSLKSSKVPKAFDGYKIVHLSDLHGEAYGENQTELIDKIKAECPDLIVVSGDTLDRQYERWENSLIVLRELSKTTPVYFSTGNHEYWTQYRKDTIKTMKKTGAVYLQNETVSLTKNGETIYLSGIDDPWYFDEVGGFKRKLSEIYPGDEKTFSMLISHRPERQDDYANAGFDLTFSGHAHGGQVRLPFTQGLIAPNQGLFPSLTAGLHEMNNRYIMISRGLGNPSKMPRYFNAPEIVVMTLSHED